MFHGFVGTACSAVSREIGRTSRWRTIRRTSAAKHDASGIRRESHRTARPVASCESERSCAAGCQKSQRGGNRESGRRGIRTPEGFRRQIYSLFQLSTLASAHRGQGPGGLGGNVGSNHPTGKPMRHPVWPIDLAGYSGFVQSQSGSLWSLVAPWRMQRRQMMASG